MERTTRTTIGVEGRETRRMGCGKCERRRVWICWEDYVRLGTLAVTWTTRVPTMRVASWVAALLNVLSACVCGGPDEEGNKHGTLTYSVDAALPATTRSFPDLVRCINSQS